MFKSNYSIKKSNFQTIHELGYKFEIQNFKTPFSPAQIPSKACIARSLCWPQPKCHTLHLQPQNALFLSFSLSPSFLFSLSIRCSIIKCTTTANRIKAAIPTVIPLSVTKPVSAIPALWNIANMLPAGTIPMMDWASAARETIEDLRQLAIFRGTHKRMGREKEKRALKIWITYPRS